MSELDTLFNYIEYLDFADSENYEELCEVFTALVDKTKELKMIDWEMENL